MYGAADLMQSQRKQALSLDDVGAESVPAEETSKHSGNKHLCRLQVGLILCAEPGLILTLFGTRSSVQKNGSNNAQENRKEAGIFQADAPGEEQERAIKGMTDVFVCADDNKLRCVFKVPPRPPDDLQKTKSVNSEQEGADEQHPRKYLMHTQRVVNPVLEVCQKENEDDFESKESKEPVRLWIP